MAESSAIVGALILSAPILGYAVKDLIGGKIYINELVVLAILSAWAGSDYWTAGLIAFLLLLTIAIELRTATGTPV